MNLQPTDYKIVLLRVRPFLNVLFYIESPCFLCSFVHLRISAFSFNKAQIRHFLAIVPYGVHCGHDSGSDPQTEKKAAHRPSGVSLASCGLYCVFGRVMRGSFPGYGQTHRSARLLPPPNPKPPKNELNTSSKSPNPPAKGP